MMNSFVSTAWWWRNSRSKKSGVEYPRGCKSEYTKGLP